MLRDQHDEPKADEQKCQHGDQRGLEEGTEHRFGIVGPGAQATDSFEERVITLQETPPAGAAVERILSADSPEVNALDEILKPLGEILTSS